MQENDGTRAHSSKTRTSEATGLDFHLPIVVFFVQSRLKKIKVVCK